MGKNIAKERDHTGDKCAFSQNSQNQHWHQNRQMLIKNNVNKSEYLQFHFALSLISKLLIDIRIIWRYLNRRIPKVLVHYMWPVELVGYSPVPVRSLPTVNWWLADWDRVAYFLYLYLFCFGLLGLLNEVCKRFTFWLDFLFLWWLLVWHFSCRLIALVVFKGCS